MNEIAVSSPSFPLPPLMLMLGVVWTTTARFRIVPVPTASSRSAPEALLRVSVNVSPSSSTVSWVIGTDTVFVVSPAGKVSVPLVAV